MQPYYTIDRTAGRRIGKKVIELENITKSYGDRRLINDFSYLFNPDDRIGIIGGLESCVDGAVSGFRDL